MGSGRASTWLKSPKVGDLDVSLRRAREAITMPMNLRFGIFGQEVAFTEIRIPFRNRPCLIISRSCGFALDAWAHFNLGAKPIVYRSHAFQQQLWNVHQTRWGE